MAEAGRKKGAGFFAVHRRTWARICDAGSLNEAAAYLVLAQGTGRDNRSTSWSATSLQRYVGISWARGKLAVGGLTSKGFIRRADNSTTERPRYELRSHAELALSDYERSLLDRLRGDKEMVLTGTVKHRLRELEERRIVARQPDGSYRAVDATNPEDLIWLPNTLITGTEAGEDPPVRRQRSAGDLWTLRLLIDLYHAQNLRDDGGISIKLLWQKYERIQVGEQGIFNVWAFKPGGAWSLATGSLAAHNRKDAEGNQPIWQSIHHLQREGLLAYVAHLWENDTDSTEIIHGYGIGGVGEEVEVALWGSGPRSRACNGARIQSRKSDRRRLSLLRSCEEHTAQRSNDRRRQTPLPATYEQNLQLVWQSLQGRTSLDTTLPGGGEKCCQKNCLESVSSKKSRHRISHLQLGIKDSQRASRVFKGFQRVSKLLRRNGKSRNR